MAVCKVFTFISHAEGLPDDIDSISSRSELERNEQASRAIAASNRAAQSMLLAIRP